MEILALLGLVQGEMAEIKAVITFGKGRGGLTSLATATACSRAFHTVPRPELREL